MRGTTGGRSAVAYCVALHTFFFFLSSCSFFLSLTAIELVDGRPEVDPQARRRPRTFGGRMAKPVWRRTEKKKTKNDKKRENMILCIAVAEIMDPSSWLVDRSPGINRSADPTCRVLFDGADSLAVTVAVASREGCGRRDENKRQPRMRCQPHVG